MLERVAGLSGLFAFILLASSSVLSQAQGYEITTHLLFVHLDGKVEVSMSLSNTSKLSSLSLTLLTSRIESLTVVDTDNRPLEFSLSGKILTVYLQATSGASVHYFTNALTTKANTTWTLSFDSVYNATVIIPPGAGILNVTPNTAKKIVGSNQTILLTPPGNWTITYSLNALPNQTPMSVTDLLLGAYLPYSISALLTGGVALSYIAWRRHSERLEMASELREEDRQILDYIRRKGGSAMLSEIRVEFHLPKSTSSRMARRLEGKGLIRIRRVGAQVRLEVT